MSGQLSLETHLNKTFKCSSIHGKIWICIVPATNDIHMTCKIKNIKTEVQIYSCSRTTVQEEYVENQLKLVNNNLTKLEQDSCKKKIKNPTFIWWIIYQKQIQNTVYSNPICGDGQKHKSAVYLIIIAAREICTYELIRAPTTSILEHLNLHVIFAFMIIKP